jgi:hypothetical protein
MTDSVVFEINPVPVIQVTIDKTGPSGNGTVDNIARASLTAHSIDNTNPHGSALIQTSLIASKATVAIINGGNVFSAKVIDFTTCGCYTCGATGTFSITVSSLSSGQRGSIHILSGATAPSITWVGVGIWIGGPPLFLANKLTTVTLFNDGTRIVGSFGNQL